MTTSVTEVTSAIAGNIDAKATDRERYELIERRLKERIAVCEKSGQRCSVASFFAGLKYFEIAQMEIKDVRLVYAPADGIGVFGGETDNWRWPRHTGDWSFLRAYVGKDGKPAAFSKDNVPFQPKHWLKVSAEGIMPGDLVFVAGYPGRTQRHQTYSQVKETTEWSMPRSIRLAQEQLAILEQLSKQDKALALKVAGRVQGLNNNLTNQKGMLEGLVKGGSLGLKQARERELEVWIDGDPARQKRYGDVLPALRVMQAESEKTREQAAAMMTLGAASTYLRRCRDHLPSGGGASQGGHRSGGGVSGARLAEDSRGAGPVAAHDGRYGGPGTARLGAGPRGRTAGGPADCGGGPGGRT